MGKGLVVKGMAELGRNVPQPVPQQAAGTALANVYGPALTSEKGVAMGDKPGVLSAAAWPWTHQPPVV